jgi:hypothetical protein
MTNPWAEVDSVLAQLPDDTRAAVTKVIDKQVAAGHWFVPEAAAHARQAVAGHQSRMARIAGREEAADDYKARIAAALAQAERERQAVTVAPAAKPTPAPKARKRNSPGFVKPPLQGKYITNADGGYFRMTNDFVDTLLPVMPAPLLRAYVYAHRLARIDGTFHISHGTLAQRIGAKDTRHGRRVMERLQGAGLVRLITRGSAATHTANTYQLVPLADLDVDKVRTAVTA